MKLKNQITKIDEYFNNTTSGELYLISNKHTLKDGKLVKKNCIFVTNKNNMNKKKVGVIIGRFQTSYLHQGHLQLIKNVVYESNEVIIMVGVSRVNKTEENPLGYKLIEDMIKHSFPNVTILPLIDQRYNSLWSKTVDYKINEVIDSNSEVTLYGSRDSFIPHYEGKFKTEEIESENETISSTSIRVNSSIKTYNNKQFRDGVIYGTFGNYPKVFPTVDVVAYTDDLKILLGKKPGEDKLRFIGGYVDVNDTSYESAATREFKEETGSEIGKLTYVSSRQINDWRYSKLKDCITTTFYIGKLLDNNFKANDDISECGLYDIKNFINNYEEIMVEHRPLMDDLIKYYKKRNLL